MKNKHKKAFTLLELLVVLVVVALLMAIIIPNLSGQREKIDQQAKINIAEIIENQANTFELIYGDETPATLNNLLTEDFITQRQKDQAEKLLDLTAETVITPPLIVE